MTLAITSKTTKAELQAEVERLTIESDAFRAKVVETALVQKDMNDWCDEGFAEAMEALGLGDAVNTKRLVTLSFVVDPSDNYDAESISALTDEEIAEYAISEASGMNLDWSTVSVKVEIPAMDAKVLSRIPLRSSNYGGWGNA